MALPRLPLAMVISLVVATPMTLRIFANDIQNEMVQLHAIESKQVSSSSRSPARPGRPTAPGRGSARIRRSWPGTCKARSPTRR